MALDPGSLVSFMPVLGQGEVRWFGIVAAGLQEKNDEVGVESVWRADKDQADVDHE